MNRLKLEVPRWNEPGLDVEARLARAPTWALYLAFLAALWILMDVGHRVLDREGGLAPLWLTSGLVLFSLLAAPLARWPLLLATGLIVGTASAVMHGRPPSMAIAFNAIAALQAAGAAWLVRLATPRVTARTLRGVAALILGPSVATAVVTVGWRLVAWTESTPPEEAPASAVAETLVALGALGAAIGALQLQNSIFAHEILLVPPVIWLAVRFGPRGGSAAVLIATLGTIYTVWNGKVVIGLVYLDPVRTALAVQLFVAVLSAPTAFVAALVAERRAAEEGRILLARAMDQTADGLGVYAEDGAILWANSAAARFYGIPLRDLVGRRAWELFPEGTLGKWRGRWTKLAAEGVTFREETTRGADGRLTPWEISTALVRVGGRE